MAISVCEVSLTESPLVFSEPDIDPEAGAVVVFWGAVRSMEAGREITGIEYEAHHAMAEHQMRLVAQSAAEKFDLREITIRHRIGFVPAGEPSLFLRVCSERRTAAFRASTDIIEKLKALVPIWKHPVYAAAQVT